MPTYTDAEAVAAYLEIFGDGEELPTGDAGDALIEQAEADIDRLLADDLERDDDTGRKLDPADLPTYQVAALANAVAAEVAYLLSVGPEVAGDDIVRSTGNVTLDPIARPPCPRAVELLAGQGFPWRTGTVGPDNAETTA